MSKRLTGIVVLLVSALASLAAAEESADVPEPMWITDVTATSTFASPKNAYAPVLTVAPRVTYLKDGSARYDSAWCEGKRDEGIGESVTITFARPEEIEEIGIKTGVWKTQRLFDANNVITGLEIVTNDGRTLTATPQPRREGVVVKVGGAPVTSVTVRITSVKKGKMNDSCLSEITFGEATVALGFDKTAAAGFPGALREAHKTLWGDGCDAKVFSRYFDLPFTYVQLVNTHSSNEDLRFKKYPRVYKTVAALAKACKSGTFSSGASLEGTHLVSSPSGTITVQAEQADTVQTMHMAWRAGQWRVTKVD